MRNLWGREGWCGSFHLSRRGEECREGGGVKGREGMCGEGGKRDGPLKGCRVYWEGG